MESIENYAKDLKKDLGTVLNDTQRIIVEKEKKSKDKEKTLSTRNTIMPVTNLYSSKKNMESLKEDPDIDFVVNAIDHVFGKNI